MDVIPTLVVPTYITSLVKFISMLFCLIIGW